MRRAFSTFFKPNELGSVHLQKVKCGRNNCRCNLGQLHTAYYHYYRKYNMFSKSKLIKEYVPKRKAKNLIKRIEEKKAVMLKIRLSESRDKEFQDMFFKDELPEDRHLTLRYKLVCKMLGRYMDRLTSSRAYKRSLRDAFYI